MDCFSSHTLSCVSLSPRLCSISTLRATHWAEFWFCFFVHQLMEILCVDSNGVESSWSSKLSISSKTVVGFVTFFRYWVRRCARLCRLKFRATYFSRSHLAAGRSSIKIWSFRKLMMTRYRWVTLTHNLLNLFDDILFFFILRWLNVNLFDSLKILNIN